MSHFTSIKTFFNSISRKAHLAEVEKKIAEVHLEKAKRNCENLKYLEQVVNQQIVPSILGKRPLGSDTCAPPAVDDTVIEISLPSNSVVMNAEQIIKDVLIEINALVNPEYLDSDDYEYNLCKPSPKCSRPQHWRSIAEQWCRGASVSSILKEFPEVGLGKDGKLAKEDCIMTRLRRWGKDYERELASGTHREVTFGGSAPAYGRDIDLELLAVIKSRMESGIKIDDDILREQLLVILNKRNMLHLLRENGGRHTFRQGWAQRFWKRHGLPSRAATTKHRELPEDFDDKLEDFITILCRTMVKYNITRLELIVNVDETNVQFVSNARRTRACRGTRKVRLQGIGKEKAQITVCLAVTATGECLPPQYIFEGTTKRCHPKVPSPAGGIYCHSKSHWQTPESFKEWITEILVPYKKDTLKKLNLPPTQWLLLILDLHYSHLDEKLVLEEFAKHQIAVVLIPAACTDQMQVLDVCCNRPFKLEVKKAFRDYTHLKFKEHVEKGLPPASFIVPLKMSDLKPQMPGFVSKGIEALRQPGMKQAIADCFQNAGCIKEAKENARVTAAKAYLDSQGLMLTLRPHIPPGTEPEAHDAYDTDNDESDDDEAAEEEKSDNN